MTQHPPAPRRKGRQWSIVAVSGLLIAGLAVTDTAVMAAERPTDDAFAVEPIDAQNWQNQYDMTWDDWKDIPDTNWNDPDVPPSQGGLSVALIAVDFPDQPFVITQPKGSDLFGNPQIDPIPRDDVPAFYRDQYMIPSETNAGRTIHEYWMEQSRGTYGIDFMDAYGPYEMPRNLFEYGLNEWGQGTACPEGETCDGRMDNDVVTAWQAGMAAEAGVTPAQWCAAKTAELGGNARNCGYDVILRTYAGYDETSIWQEFGQMMFPTKESIPDEWGPPAEFNKDGKLDNWAPTRYVEWTSWRAAAQQWGLSSIRQAESSGTITHEIGHFFFQVGDNNNNPFSHLQNPPTPLHRVGSAPWDMMDRGSFNGPGGHHMRWVVPANQGGWSPSGLMVRNKRHMGLLPEENLVRVQRDSLDDTGLILDTVTARAVDPGADGTSGIWVEWPHADDKTPACDVNTDPLCDGGSWDNYTLEVIDRMGFDSFNPDNGVLLAKNKWGNAQDPEGGGHLGYRNGEDSLCGYNCLNWVIDANPQDIEMVDYYQPTEPGKWATGGEPVMATIADHRQLNDALFKAGENSGSQKEWVDEANGLHFYVVDTQRDADGVLSYTLAVRSLAGAGPHARGVSTTDVAPKLFEQHKAATCTFPVTNTGSTAAIDAALHPSDVSTKVDGDVYRLSATANGEGWNAELANTLAAARTGQFTSVPVYVYPTGDAADSTVVTLTATSESDPSKTATAECTVDTALLESDPEVALDAQVTARCLAGKVYTSVTVRNEDTVPADIAITSDHGGKTFTSVQPGASASVSINTRTATLAAGDVDISGTADGRADHRSTATHPAHTCG
ncbi:peptidase M6 [Microbacterium sp. NPDC055910]|uniref:peptidase M6 n=1 Tax=Microbacterium sp. NPDC055910 TaxID=3345659 RepID=UPI0035D6A230